MFYALVEKICVVRLDKKQWIRLFSAINMLLTIAVFSVGTNITCNRQIMLFRNIKGKSIKVKLSQERIKQLRQRISFNYYTC